MFFYEGLSCPVCEQPFTETDDIVACPDCGAPHHRVCWQQNGGCAFAAAHGTEEQWSRDRALKRPAPTEQAESAADTTETRCPNCGASNPAFAGFCGHCGRELPQNDWSSEPIDDEEEDEKPFDTDTGRFNEYAPFRAAVFDPCGGVPPEESIEGEKAADLAAVTRTNSAYYLPRFQRMARQGTRASWNWSAFLIPSYWLLYRKQYWLGGLLAAFDALQTLISAYVLQTYFAAATAATNYADMLNSILQIAQNGSARLAMTLLSVLSLTGFLLRILIGLLGNRLYMRHCLSVVRKARENYPEGYAAQLTMLGGTSVVLPLLAYMLLNMLSVFTAAF